MHILTDIVVALIVVLIYHLWVAGRTFTATTLSGRLRELLVPPPWARGDAAGIPAQPDKNAASGPTPLPMASPAAPVPVSVAPPVALSAVPAAPVLAAPPVAPSPAPAPVAASSNGLEGEIAAVIAAAVAVVLDGPMRILSVQQITAPVPAYLNVWAYEGRLQIFTSHKVR